MEWKLADGRMLKKTISTSKKLANLKTDTARLIYTWLIPHLDVDGRFSADPAVIKGNIVPRVAHIGVKKVQTALKDMADNDLVMVYEANGDIFLELNNFNKHQTLRRDREKESIIPPPGNIREHSGSTPPQVKIKKDKVKEGKVNDQDNILFQEFWNLYDKKIDKGKCEEWYDDVDDVLHLEIMDGIKRWKASGNWNDNQFQPYPMTFLNNKRWEDEPQSREKVDPDVEKWMKGEI